MTPALASKTCSPGPVGHLGGEPAVLVDRAHDGDAGLLAGRQVGLAEARAPGGRRRCPPSVSTQSAPRTTNAFGVSAKKSNSGV